MIYISPERDRIEMRNNYRHTTLYPPQKPGPFDAEESKVYAALLPHLSWRHHGIGVLQAYVPGP